MSHDLVNEYKNINPDHMHQHLDPNPNFTVPNCVRSKIVSIGVYKTFTQSIP